MSQSESTAPRRGRDASDEPADDTTAPAARHALEETEPATQGWRGRRRVKVGVAITAAALLLGSLGAIAVRGSDSSLETTVAQDSPQATASVAARATDQVNRSSRRSALPSASGLDTADIEAAVKAAAAVKVTAPAKPATTAAKPATKKPTATPAAPQWPTVLWKARGTRYATTNLNIRATPTEASAVVTVVAPGTALATTAAVFGDYRQVTWKGKAAWVSKAYLSTEKPVAATSSSSSSGSVGTSSGTTSGSCSKSMPAGVIAAGRAAALEACQRFPAITSFGGYRAGDSGEHGSGHAVDMMVSGQAGWEVARWARANASRLGITEVIYAQQIWTTQRAGDGWRPMSDRGSTTANHYDHVHITLG
ncbi:hypothetical protein ACSDQ9_07400 [Aestuariimicrobium soli]|uniref:hypothetical protein n=1 Tax=Aestuariimicrobium soli TaxID=2035834 RepID=UPI003EB9DA3A